MFNRTNVVYLFDGSFDGLMTAVFTAYEYREEPVAILEENDSLFTEKIITTNELKAARVIKKIFDIAGEEPLYRIKLVYLSDERERGKYIFDYVGLCLKNGKNVNRDVGNDIVDFILKTSRYVSGESHKFKMFTRFSQSGGVWTAKIEPRAKILPMLGSYFIMRFPNEKFLIYDEAHEMAFVFQDGKGEIIPLSGFSEDNISAEEMEYRKLFKLFYDTIEIKPRHNEKCRMTHMPKRFWKNMTEFSTNIDLIASHSD